MFDTLGTSVDGDLEKLVIGVSDINSKLIESNLHLNNIQTLLQILFQLALIVIVFKGLYFILDKVFFNDC